MIAATRLTPCHSLVSRLTAVNNSPRYRTQRRKHRFDGCNRSSMWPIGNVHPMGTIPLDCARSGQLPEEESSSILGTTRGVDSIFISASCRVDHWNQRHSNRQATLIVGVTDAPIE